MRKIIQVIVFIGVFIPVVSFGQLGMKLTVPKSNYMLYEPILVCLTLRNDSGKALIFGEDPRLQGFISFNLIDMYGKKITKRKNREFSAKGIVLKPGEIKNIILPLSNFYDLEKVGKFTVNAYASHNMLPIEYRSDIKRFNVKNGTVFWQRNVGVPDVLQKNKNINSEQRTYTMRSLMDESTFVYYLIIEDDEKVYSVMRVGKKISQEKFDADVDMLSRLHMLIPVSSSVFNYLVFELDGSNTTNSFYKKNGSSTPTLIRDPKSGRVMLSGGKPAIAGVDYDNPRANMLSAEELMNKNSSSLPR